MNAHEVFQDAYRVLVLIVNAIIGLIALAALIVGPSALPSVGIGSSGLVLYMIFVSGWLLAAVSAITGIVMSLIPLKRAVRWRHAVRRLAVVSLLILIVMGCVICAVEPNDIFSFLLLAAVLGFGALNWTALRSREPTADQSHAVCEHCGYDLRGAAHVQCPECGKVIDTGAVV